MAAKKNPSASIKITPTNFAFEFITQKNFYTHTRLVGQI